MCAKISLIGINDAGKTSLLLSLRHLIAQSKIVTSVPPTGDVKSIDIAYDIILSLSHSESKTENLIEKYRATKNRIRKFSARIKDGSDEYLLEFNVVREDQLNYIDPLNLGEDEDLPKEGKNLLQDIARSDVLALVVDPARYVDISNETLKQSRLLTFVQVALKRIVNVDPFPTIAILIPKIDKFPDIVQDPSKWLYDNDSFIIAHAKLYTGNPSIFTIAAFGKNTSDFNGLTYPTDQWEPQGVDEFLKFLREISKKEK